MPRAPRARTVNWDWLAFLHDARVIGMNATALGMWTRILGAFALAETPGILACDEQALREIARATPEDWSAHGQQVMACMKRTRRGFEHARTLRDHDAQTARVAATRAVKQAAALKRWENGATDARAYAPALQPQSKRIADAMPPSLLPSVSPEPEPTHMSAPALELTEAPSRTPAQERDADWREAFVQLWWLDYRALGRECSKARALEAWMRIPHADPQAAYDALNAAWERTVRTWRAENRPVDKFQHAATWLNDYAKNLALGD